MKYYRLTDNLNMGEIVKSVSPSEEYRYSFGEDKWVPSTIMSLYRSGSGEFSGKYEETDENAVPEYIKSMSKKYDELLKLADKTAAEMHKDQVDKGGHPYIEHPRAVAASLKNTEYKIIGLLHDVVEDTPVTFDDLRAMGFTERIVNSIRLVTKTENYVYEEYLSEIRKDEGARNVKMADLRHNMDLSRIPSPTEKDMERIEKYKKSLAFLEGKIQEYK